MTSLHAYALNLLGADDDAGFLRTEDSFGEVHVWPRPNGLELQDHRSGQNGRVLTVRTQRAVRDALMPRLPLNSAGLTTGRVLSPLGPLTFTVDRLRVDTGQTRLHLSQSGHLITLGGVQYDGFSTACTGMRPTRNLPTVVRRVTTGEFDMPTGYVARLLWRLVFALHGPLVTPQAAWQARLNEAQAAVHQAEESVRTAERQLSAAHGALKAVQDEAPHDAA